MAGSTDIAFCAGLFEGEGCLHSSLYFKDSKTKVLKRRGTPSIQATIKMTDKEPLDRFVAAFDGSLLGPHLPPSHKPHWKLQWVWRTYDRTAILKMMNAFWEYLSPRRREQAFELYHWFGAVG